MSAPKKKRVTLKRKSPPNPLFEKWLEEWKNEAASKGSDMQYCFGKALNSLRKYPLPLKTGRDCGVLDYFGNRLCIMLDRRLSEYKKDHPEAVQDLLPDPNVIAESSPAKRPAKAPKRKSTGDVIKKPSGGGGKKPYSPAWRSGPYAILLTLLEESQKPNYSGFLTKADIQNKAQPLCDVSFTRPDPGSHYTAWSSMATLVKRGLVDRQGNPAKFNLTDAGVALAIKLHEVDTTSQSKSDNASIEISDEEENLAKSLESNERLLPEPSVSTTKAVNLVPKPRGGGGKKPYSPAWRSGPYAILITLLEESQKPNYPGFLTKADIQNKAQPLCDISFTRPDPGSHYTAWSSMSTLVKRGLVDRQGNPAKFKLTDAGVALSIKLHEVDATSQKKSDNIEISDEEELSVKSLESCSNERLLPEPSVSTTKTVNTAPASPRKRRCKSPVIDQNNSDDTIILVPGSFDVLLLVDKMETTMEVAAQRIMRQGTTMGDLSAMGTLFELRHLKVGDFAWVCRDRTSGKELVLPYIVERKRMDDLAKSIQDGRFHEQKFRMKQCGVQNLIYLVESHGDNTHTSLPLESLQQAIINTQVVDGFTVKMTSSHRDSMRYLSNMTNMLSSVYQNKTVVSCRQDNLPPSNIADDLISLMKFSEFNNASSKVKVLGVQDMFVKQLLQLYGLSVEKAQAIVEKYPTPRILMAAFQSEGSDAHKLLASIRYGALKRLIGPVISKTVSQLYTQLYLS